MCVWKIKFHFYHIIKWSLCTTLFVRKPPDWAAKLIVQFTVAVPTLCVIMLRVFLYSLYGVALRSLIQHIYYHNFITLLSITTACSKRLNLKICVFNWIQKIADNNTRIIRQNLICITVNTGAGTIYLTVQTFHIYIKKIKITIFQIYLILSILNLFVLTLPLEHVLYWEMLLYFADEVTIRPYEAPEGFLCWMGVEEWSTIVYVYWC